MAAEPATKEFGLNRPMIKGPSSFFYPSSQEKKKHAYSQEKK
jgi:hypothetical protein